MNRKIPKSKWIPALLLIYLAVMIITFGKENISNGETVKFVVIILIVLLVIIALYFFLKKKENS